MSGIFRQHNLIGPRHGKGEKRVGKNLQSIESFAYGEYTVNDVNGHHKILLGMCSSSDESLSAA
jgi:hypothetical protein